MSPTTNTDSVSAIAAASLQNTKPFAEDAEWLLAIPIKGQTRLYTLRIPRGQTGATIMNLIRKEYEANRPAKRWFHMGVVLEDATVSPVSGPKPGSNSTKSI